MEMTTKLLAAPAHTVANIELWSSGVFCVECGAYVGRPVGHARLCLPCGMALGKFTVSSLQSCGVTVGGGR